MSMKRIKTQIERIPKNSNLYGDQDSWDVYENDDLIGLHLPTKKAAQDRAREYKREQEEK